MPDTADGHQAQALGMWRWLSTYQQWPSFDRLLYLTFGARIVAVLHQLADLSVADQLADGPRGVDKLAAATGTDPGVLYRLLRAAAAIGFFEELPDGRWTNNEDSRYLLSGAETSLRDLVVFSGGEILTRTYGALGAALRTGVPAFCHVYGSQFYDYMDAHPDQAALFDLTMVQRSRLTATALISTIDFTRFATILDVAGGWGHLVGEALTRYPHLTAGLLERPAVLPRATALLKEYGVTDRVTLIGGDYLAGIPRGADAYFLNAVLNGLSDADAHRVLRNVREAIGDNARARAFICDKVLTAVKNQWDYSKLIDLDLLLLTGGKERTFAQWRELTAACGFELTGPPPGGSSPWAALECRPA
jgi:multifunctional cyclase/dehydratase/O-methyltransferase